MHFRFGCYRTPDFRAKRVSPKLPRQPAATTKPRKPTSQGTIGPGASSPPQHGPVTAKLCKVATPNNSRILFKVPGLKSREAGLSQLVFPAFRPANCKKAKQSLKTKM